MLGAKYSVCPCSMPLLGLTHSYNHDEIQELIAGRLSQLGTEISSQATSRIIGRQESEKEASSPASMSPDCDFEKILGRFFSCHLQTIPNVRLFSCPRFLFACGSCLPMPCVWECLVRCYLEWYQVGSGTLYPIRRCCWCFWHFFALC